MCDQRTLSLTAFDGEGRRPAGALAGLQYGPVAPVDLGDTDAILPRQCLGQRAFHDVLQPSETVEVESERVQTGDPAELGLVLGDDGEVAVDRAFGPPDRSAVVHKGAALSTEDVRATGAVVSGARFVHPWRKWIPAQVHDRS